MKKTVIYIFLFWSFISVGQIANYNQFPSKTPTHILDEKLVDISFALSMRVLVSDYNGPLIRLRRSSDNQERDFTWADNDILDVAAINSWRGASNVFVVIWYDQSGLGRNATQGSINNQPQFFSTVAFPYFQGDGSNDHLTVDTPRGIQDVTNNGNQGTVLGIMKASRKNQHSFGVLIGRNRWSSHLNWGNNNVYFDPGACCNNPRVFNNSSKTNLWEQYTFIKTTTNAIARSAGVQRFNGTHTTGRCTLEEDFAIGWATGNENGNHATTAFLELVMYKTDISDFVEIEDNSRSFWDL